MNLLRVRAQYLHIKILPNSDLPARAASCQARQTRVRLFDQKSMSLRKSAAITHHASAFFKAKNLKRKAHALILTTPRDPL